MKIYRISAIGEGPIQYNEENTKPDIETIPNKLYHVTNSWNIDKIKEEGLKTNPIERTFPSFSKSVVYLANAEAIHDLLPMHGAGGSVVLEIDTNALNKDLLWNDQNVPNPDYFEYHGNIPKSAIKVLPWIGTAVE